MLQSVTESRRISSPFPCVSSFLLPDHGIRLLRFSGTKITSTTASCVISGVVPCSLLHGIPRASFLAAAALSFADGTACEQFLANWSLGLHVSVCEESLRICFP